VSYADLGLRAVPPFFWPVGQGDEPADSAPAYEVLGHDEATWVCVEDNGQVRSFDPSGRLPARSVNASLQLFARSLTIFADAWASRAALDDGDAHEQARGLRRTLTDIDSTIATEESWWSVILEQLDLDQL
jgi:hypothetical protein